jgi:hypothetical protein
MIYLLTYRALEILDSPVGFTILFLTIGPWVG